ncbi:hypothetical protein T440DRAFT_521703 [Plenodomus tracheiphilus IPT5]|uniref:Tat pathway signal sequence n=1 Tax=Plenodomus tracheiphilus IPT5 TaxID=1408161 RepID=A0A6A7ATX8_9PLEO|nr:hypothetical protein T440DRAFT_521703 [Plenodomus tracheiphilus IPT5]
MAREYVYGKVDQTEEANIIDSDGNFESNSSRARRFLSRYRNAIKNLFVALVVISSFFTGFFIHPVASSAWNVTNAYSKEAGSTHTFLPQFSHRIERFVLNDSFHDPPSREVTAAWTSLIPKGQGAIRLPVSNEYGNDIYNIAVFHGIHCLYTLRQSFFAFHQMATALEPIDRPAYQTAYMLKHGSHCIEYLRQQLMCRPDLTFEPIDLETGSPKDWDVERTCVDWDEISAWAVQERSNNEVGIV